MSEQPERVEAPLPERPYRKSLLLNFGLAAVLFTFAWLLGSLVDAVIYAAFYFVVSIAWTWFRLRKRIAKERA